MRYRSVRCARTLPDGSASPTTSKRSGMAKRFGRCSTWLISPPPINPGLIFVHSGLHRKTRLPGAVGEIAKAHAGIGERMRPGGILLGFRHDPAGISGVVK